MKQHLIVRVNEPQLQPASELHWFLFDQNCQLQSNGLNAVNDIAQAAIAEDTSNVAITVIIPNDVVLLTSVNIPTQNARQIKQALPFAIEEMISEELENVHMAIAPNNGSSQNAEIDVAVIKHSYLINWLDIFCHARLSPDAIVIDSLCVPYSSGSSLLADDKQLYYRIGQYKGVSCKPDDFIHLSKSESEAQEANDSIELISCCDSAEILPHDLNNVIELHYKESVNEVLAATAVKQQANNLNLLQGGYQQNTHHESTWGLWKLPLISAAASIVVFLLAHLGAGFYFNYQADQLVDESISYYKTLFPNERRVVSPRRQLQNHLRLVSTGDSGDFLNALSSISDEIKQFTVESKITVNQLSFNQDSNSLKFELTSETIEQLDQLKQQLAAVGMNAAIGSARVQETGVISQMTVELN